VGTTVEFKRPGSFPPVTDMVGGGHFRLKPGQWTDDTSMALCLAESLVECGGFHPVDQLKRYVRWADEGYLSCTGSCFDIGNTVRRALERFREKPQPFPGPTEEHSAGNGSIMRLAPVPLAYARDPVEAVEKSGESSRTTHGVRDCVDACRYFGALIVSAVNAASKDEILGAVRGPAPGYWDARPLSENIARIASGSFKIREPPEIRGSGWAVASLEAALWAFHRTSSFREGCLKAVNLGDDADTTAAVYGQIAGAHYGLSGIPSEWIEKVAMREMIADFADRLHELSQTLCGDG
jgi:ADP-ribosyl-[dinitrogen reductase] hydrolase